MTREYKRWIFTKACDFAPAGTLQLGQVLAKPKDPAYVLQPTGPLDLHEGMKVEHVTRVNLNMQTNDEMTGQFSAWAKLGYLPAYFKASAATQRSHDYVWHFETLESYTTSPTLAYVTAAMRHGDVPATLKGFLFKTRVYMVTGVRVAKGARMRRRDQASTSLEAAGQTSGPDQSVTAGTQVKMEEKKLDAEDFDKSSDFIFAYRLNEVRYRGTVTHKPYAGGETAYADAPRAGTKSEIVLDDFEVLKIVDIPVGKDAKNFEAITVPGFEDLECYSALWAGSIAGSIIGAFLNDTSSSTLGSERVSLLAWYDGLRFSVLLLHTHRSSDYQPSSVGPAYAFGLPPLAICSYPAAYPNMCFAIGQFIGAGVLQGFLAHDDQWSYWLPFAVQWIWLAPLVIAGVFMPESLWLLVRNGQHEEAERHSDASLQAHSERSLDKWTS
ncbi:hypothetical protein EDB80DRAFT_895847 [Ilyonectria destructans]|nr:hypothetical protein EDB80DRAFT_895847 [Ilyonectria destructans]